MSDESEGTIKLFQADLVDEESFEKPLENCEKVFHTAAPFKWKYSDAIKEFYKHVVQGTKNVFWKRRTSQTL